MAICIPLYTILFARKAAATSEKKHQKCVKVINMHYLKLMIYSNMQMILLFWYLSTLSQILSLTCKVMGCYQSTYSKLK